MLFGSHNSNIFSQDAQPKAAVLGRVKHVIMTVIVPSFAVLHSINNRCII